MLRPRFIQSAILFAAFAAASATLPAQTAGTASNPSTSALSSASLPTRLVPPMADPISQAPFARSNRHLADPFRLEMRPAAQMTREDQDLVANAQSYIQERAGFETLEFNEGSWAYTQIVCPALPNHLFVRFSRDDGTRQTSMFSVSIPRNGEGRVRLIPNLRKGYSLFSPAPINKLTIAVFNHIRAEEKYDLPPDWLGTGLCYATLAGANPVATNPQAADALEKPLTMGPALRVFDTGGATIDFADIDAAPRPMEWVMIFDRKAHLVKATHKPAYVATVRQVSVDPRDRPGYPEPQPDK